MFFAQVVDISPIGQSVASIFGVVLTVVVGWVGWYAKNWLSKKVDLTQTQLDEQIQQTFNEAAARAIAYAETVVAGAIPKDVKVDNPFVKIAADYVIRFWPDMIKKLGMTPEKVRETILARLPSGEATKKADAIVMAKAGSPAAPGAPKK